MTDLRYEPLPPTVVYQRITREGRFVVYFVPNTQTTEFEFGTMPVTQQQSDSPSRPQVHTRVA